MAEESVVEQPTSAPDAPAPDASAPASPDTGATPASPAPDAGATDKPEAGDPPKSALDAVRRVMDASRMEAADKAKQQPATAKPEGEAAAAPAGDVDLTRERIDKAEWDAMSPLARSRINAFRGKIKEYGGLLHDMAPKAKTFDDLNGWMGSVRMTQDEFVSGLQIMALMKTDPAKAWQAL